MKSIAQLGRDHSWVVVVESADGDGVIQQHAVIGYVGNGSGEIPVFPESVARRDIECRVNWKIIALIRTDPGTGKPIVKARAVIHIR